MILATYRVNQILKWAAMIILDGEANATRFGGNFFIAFRTAFSIGL